MANFSYRGRDGSGELLSGIMESESQSACARQLISRGITPVSIQESKPHAVPVEVNFSLRSRQAKPKLDDVIFFCRQMFTLSRSGVPLIRGLGGLAETTSSPALAAALVDIIHHLEGGYRLSQAFAHQGKLFPPIFIGVLQVGESSGRVDEAFVQLASYLERERDTKERVKTAMRYPIMVLIAISFAMAVINFFVIPAFAKVFAGFNAELPLPTKILLATSNFAVSYWYLVIGGTALAVWLWLRFIASDKGGLWWDRVKLRIPVVGPVLTKSLLARFARSFSTMLQSGVPIIQGVNLLAESMDNAYFSSLVLDLRRSLERGDSISHTAAEMGIFPPLMLQMIAVGEETGRIDNMLAEVADFYDREVDYGLKNLSSAIEPILIVIVGILVLILALGVFLPMWDLGRAANVKH